MTQVTMDDVERSTRAVSRCPYLRRDATSGMRIGDGSITIMGTCRMKGGTVYDRDCDGCLMDPANSREASE